MKVENQKSNSLSKNSSDMTSKMDSKTDSKVLDKKSEETPTEESALAKFMLGSLSTLNSKKVSISSLSSLKKPLRSVFSEDDLAS